MHLKIFVAVTLESFISPNCLQLYSTSHYSVRNLAARVNGHWLNNVLFKLNKFGLNILNDEFLLLCILQKINIKV